LDGTLQNLARAVRHNTAGLPIAADFDQTKISDADLAGLSKTPTLHALYLYDTAITDSGLKHLHALTNLTLLYLPATQVTPEGIANLRKELPNCTVILPTANTSP
tara:strand:+ start:237 stop:551 length:315 start_codon:yes stop_codon:yes gene_type:complete